MASELEVFKDTDNVITITFPTGTDLNGDTIFFTVKRAVGGSGDDSDAILKNDVTVATSTNVVQIPLADTLTNVAPGRYICDVKRVTSGGEKKSLPSVPFIIHNTVTQRSS
jgi:hypothetical protein